MADKKKKNTEGEAPKAGAEATAVADAGNGVTGEEDQVTAIVKVPALYEKFSAIASEIALLEHDEPARGLVLAALTNNHTCMLGPPGTGKSMIAKEFAKRIGGRYFYKLLSRDLPPDELLVNDYVIREWSDGDKKHTQFHKNWEKMLPDSEIVFLDEAFKANSTTLNKLLDIILDREFMINGKTEKAKTITCVLASNETPEDECKAFYDRVLFRYVMHYIMEPGNFVRMLDFSYDSNGTTCTLEELKAAQEQVKLMPVPADVQKKFATLRNEMDHEGVTHSNRRWRGCYDIIKANAWIEGKTEVDEDSIEILQHCLWNTPTGEEVKKVRDLVLQSVNPIAQKLIELYENATDVVRKISSHKEENDRSKAAIEANGKLKTIQKEMKSKVKEIEAKGKPAAKYQALVDKITIMQSELVTEYLGVDLK